MKHYILRNSAEFNGGFTDLFILGATRAANFGNDFTAAALTQTINLLPLSVGDVVLAPQTMIQLRQAFTDQTTFIAPVTLANLKCDVGVAAINTAGTNVITGVNADLQPAFISAVPANYPCAAAGAAIAAVANKTAAQYLTATLTASAGNISTIKFGEIWIFTTLARVADWNRDRDL